MSRVAILFEETWKGFRSLLLVCSMTVPAFAQSNMGVPGISPSTGVIGNPSIITVTVSIVDPSVIPESVMLLRLNVDGSSTILANLHDDGMNGDAYARDLVFSGQVTLNSSVASQINLQVSAAFKGTLMRVRSDPFNFFFQAANAPQQSLILLAQALASGDTKTALTYVVPSDSTIRALTTFNREGLNALATMLEQALPVSSQGDLRVLSSQFVSPSGVANTVEITMVPGPQGRWLVNTW